MKVYIAGPIQGGGRYGENVHNAIKAADRVLEAGHHPFVPHLFALWDIVSPESKSKGVWMSLDMAWLDACDCLVRIEGESEGAEMEVEYAKKSGIPVYHGVDDFLKSTEESS